MYLCTVLIKDVTPRWRNRQTRWSQTPVEQSIPVRSRVWVPRWREVYFSPFFVYIPQYIYTFIPAYLPTYILSYPPFHENVYSDLFRISLTIFGFSKDNIYLCRRNNLYIITQQTEKIDEEIFQHGMCLLVGDKCPGNRHQEV